MSVEWDNGYMNGIYSVIYSILLFTHCDPLQGFTPLLSQNKVGCSGLKWVSLEFFFWNPWSHFPLFSNVCFAYSNSKQAHHFGPCVGIILLFLFKPYLTFPEGIALQAWVRMQIPYTTLCKDDFILFSSVFPKECDPNAKNQVDIMIAIQLIVGSKV